MTQQGTITTEQIIDLVAAEIREFRSGTQDAGDNMFFAGTMYGLKQVCTLAGLDWRAIHDAAKARAGTDTR